MLTRTAICGGLVAFAAGCAAPLDDVGAAETGGAAGTMASGGGSAGTGGTKASGGSGGGSGGNASGGSAGTTACNAGFADCDGNAANGCETTTASDPWNCGGCGVVCSIDHSSAKCEQGSCVLSCLPSWGDCDGKAATGCEAALSSADNCGACGVKCAGAGVHSSGACSSSGCTSQCDAGYADCDGSAGCETDVASDPKNCGACGHDCGSQPCSAGECQPSVVFSDSSASPAGMALDANYVYLTDYYGDRVVKAPKAGGASIDLATSTSGPNGITLDASFVYWASDTDEALWKVPLGGGPPAKVASISSGDTTAGLAVEKDALYWLGGDSLHRTSLTSGVTITLAPTTTPTSLSLYIDGSEAYWASWYDQEVLRVPLSGGAPTVIASASYPNDVAIDAKYVYYGDDQGLWKAPKAGGAPSALVTTSSGVYNLACDGVDVFYTDGTSLYKVSTSGGQALLLHSAGSATAVAVDQAYVYWTDNSAGSVLRLPK